ncbi:MAG: hypothetical protein QM724_11070 [Flavobacteriales bacterium]
MKRSLIIALASLVILTASAQKKPYDDLLVKFVDEKYEDCLSKAESYTQKDDHKKDPLPYLYVSMCLYEMSKIEKYRAMDEYKKADKEALKWAEKYRKKDKNKEYFDNYADYWSELNSMAQESGMNFYEEGPKGMSKAKQTFDSMTGYYPENPGPWLMMGLVQYRSNLAKEGDASIAKYKAALDAAGGITSLPDDQKKLMKGALIKYAEYLDSKGDKSGAKAALEVGKDAFMEDAEFKGAYESY